MCALVELGFVKGSTVLEQFVGDFLRDCVIASA